ncbi:MAG: elongation factor G [Lentisphaeria bacterium]|nr:elongation factor G [Candidatus Neomarinimicrobiota bacterium]MCF7842192.1 elongation factor G [Lentisphaeria bacterium]
MKEYHVKDIRNVAIVGHAATGKTSLVEAMLYATGATTRLGNVNEGNTKSDYLSAEIERQHSISTALLTVEWNSSKFNILDAPGASDFIGDALSAVRVADVGLISVSGTSGLEMGTEVMWNFCEQFKIPRIFVINMLDKEHVNFRGAFDALKSSFGNHVTLLQIPIGEGVGFHKIADIIRKKVLVFDTKSGKYTQEDIPADLKDEVDQLHLELVEQVAETDDSLMEKYFEEGSLSEDDLRAGLRDGIIHKQIFPVFCTAAAAMTGVTRLLEIIEKYVPSPAETLPEITTEGTELVCDENGNAAAYVFKTSSEAHVGELSFFRVYSGKVVSNMDMVNKSRNTTERLGHIYIVNGHDRHEISALMAGDIGATVKLKDTHTGDTLSHPKSPVVIKPVEYPPPNIQAAIVAKAKGEEEKISAGLVMLHDEDPTFFYEVDPELGQTIISGQGELQLQIAFNKLKERYKVDVLMVEPKIAYRETIKGNGESKYRHKKQSGGAGQFAEVWMRVESLPRGEGLVFEETLVGQNVDRVFVPSVEKGVKATSQNGPLAGYPVVDVKAVFYDGKMHPVDSKDIAFQIAGKAAFKEAFLQAKPCLLEPIFDIEVSVPEEFMGDVMGDITARRGRIGGMDTDGHFQVLKAKVPLANLYKYSTVLRSITQGKASHRQKFSHYEEVPRDEEQKIIAAAKAAKEEE